MNSRSSDFEQFGYSWKDRLQDYRVLFIILLSCLSVYVFLRSIVRLFVMLFSLSSGTPIPASLMEETVAGLLLPLMQAGYAHGNYSTVAKFTFNSPGNSAHYLWGTSQGEAARYISLQSIIAQ